jgi:hypothetical protein
MVSKVKVKAIIEAAIAEQSFQSQKWVVSDHIFILDVIMDEVLCGKSSC